MVIMSFSVSSRVNKRVYVFMTSIRVNHLAMACWTGLCHVFQALFTCSHTRARVVEGKTFCPDCGQGVVFRWVVLRCCGCRQRRPVRYRFRHVVPLESCCTYCGESDIINQYLDEPEFYQLRHALLSFETEVSESSLLERLAATIEMFLKDTVYAGDERHAVLPRLTIRFSP